MSLKAMHTSLNVSKTIINRNLNTSVKLAATVLNNNHSTQTTVDPKEVEIHTKQLKDWWDPNGTLKALHSFNVIRVPLIRDGLVPPTLTERSHLPLKDKKILDVGCGGGILSEGLSRIGANVTGIDASKELIELAKTHSELNPKIANNKPTYCFSSIEEHALTHPEYYDGVVASEVIEHVNNKELFVKSCVQALKPGGRIFFTTPNRTRLSQFFTICVAENVLKLVEKGTHQYDKYITPNELTFLLERNNCHLELVHGLFYHFLTNKWEFVKSQSLLYALQAVKLSECT